MAVLLNIRFAGLTRPELPVRLHLQGMLAFVLRQTRPRRAAASGRTGGTRLHSLSRIFQARPRTRPLKRAFRHFNLRRQPRLREHASLTICLPNIRKTDPPWKRRQFQKGSQVSVVHSESVSKHDLPPQPVGGKTIHPKRVSRPASPSRARMSFSETGIGADGSSPAGRSIYKAMLVA